MLSRIDDFFDFLGVESGERERGVQLAQTYADRARGMTRLKDYQALAALGLHYRPRLIFEIGTYRGVTSDFFLALLPDAEVVSIAYVRPCWKVFSRLFFNNSELTRAQVGSAVAPERRSRFTQLHGDSHKLDAETMRAKFGAFDLVFIDGDHSAQGVALDTSLAQQIVSESGIICWHDANPKPDYTDVRRYLEDDLPLHAIATRDNYVGGVAAWSREIGSRLGASALKATQG